MMWTRRPVPRSARAWFVVVALATALALAGRPGSAGAASCPGDCNGDGATTINELLVGVRIALGDVAVAQCEAMDSEQRGHVDVSDLVAAVQAALAGCHVPSPTASPTPTATPPPEATAGTGLRTVLLTVATSDGAPVDGFEVRFDERGERTSSQTVDVAHGASATYTVKDVAAAVVVLVSSDGYYSAVGVLDAPADPQHATTSEPLQVRLAPKGGCIKMADDCVGQTADGTFVPGAVIVGMDDWLWPDEADAALEPYCLPIDGLDVGKTVSMWVDVVRGEPSAAIAALEASAQVQHADVRGYDGGGVTGTSIFVVFGLQVTINEARDLIDSIDGLRWLRTTVSPTVLTVLVAPGQEAAWACQLKRDPDVAYASLDTIIAVPEQSSAPR